METERAKEGSELLTQLRFKYLVRSKPLLEPKAHNFDAVQQRSKQARASSHETQESRDLTQLSMSSA